MVTKMKESIKRLLLLPAQAVGVLIFLCVYLFTFWFEDEDNSDDSLYPKPIFLPEYDGEVKKHEK
jgi:hypothetical protein